jgi:hypothetical protein
MRPIGAAPPTSGQPMATAWQDALRAAIGLLGFRVLAR